MSLRLPIILNLLAFILSFGGGFIYYRVELDFHQKRTSEYSSLVGHLVWSYNREAMSSFLQGLLGNKDYYRISIKEKNGEDLISVEQKSPFKSYLYLWDKKISFRDEIKYKDESLGTFEIVMHDHERLAQIICGFIFIIFHLIIQFVLALISSRKKNRELENQIVQSEKLAAIGTMGAGIAHEINNPLTIVMGHAYLLQETVTKKYESDPLLLNMVSKIISSVERIKKIVEHMKDFSRNSSLDNKVLISVKQSFEDTLIFVMPILKKNKIELTLNIPDDLLKINVNRIEIESVFQNLLVNAADALLRRSEPRKITVNAKSLPSENSVEITFADNGEGIPQKNLSKIFDPFYTTKDVGKGTGLGLAICKKIIEKHMGRINVFSIEGEGTTFVIVLPRGSLE